VALPALASLKLVAIDVLHTDDPCTPAAARLQPAPAAALCNGLAACTSLTELDLLDAISTTSGLLDALPPLLDPLPRLEMLRLWHCHADAYINSSGANWLRSQERLLAEYMSHITRLPRLPHLDLSATHIARSGASH
jgi:hypothetical protein